MIVFAILAATAVFAQGMGGRVPMGGDDGGDTLMLQTNKGLFALRSGVLAKYTVNPLKQAEVLQLFGPAPEMPPDATDRTAMQKYATEMQRRRAPAIMLSQDNALLLIVGDGFARINQDTLEVEAVADLRPAAPAGGDGTATTGARRPEPAPGYLLDKHTLYLVRNTEILALSITDGKILSRLPLPKEMQRAQGGPFTGGARGADGERPPRGGDADNRSAPRADR
jgi:hypothetical protein